MSPKKKIALLNLQVDANFGGHLQRYALITVLQRMGYDVTHLNTRFPSAKKTLLKYLKGGSKRLLLYPFYALRRSAEYLPLRYFKYYIKHEAITEAFYEKYIPHTSRIYSNEELARYQDYDCFVVGSDQVWRKSIAANYGLFTYLFDYLPKDKKRIAYGVSLGTDKSELTEEDEKLFRELYARFEGVSVREDSGLKLLQGYECDKPQAELVIDPTLLLGADDYSQLIEDGHTSALQEDIFCYILDKEEGKIAFIAKVAQEKGMTYRIWESMDHYSVEQWLRSIRDAEVIITDSYHGMLFSIIFNKPFVLMKNDFRGNARFASVIASLGIDLKKEMQDFNEINKKIDGLRKSSLDFLSSNLQ